MVKAIPPDILYKFFPSKREDFFDMPALRFTPIRELNDPFESNLSLGNKFCNPQFLDQIQLTFINMMNKFTDAGVLSLTTNHDNLLMWAHYANNHTGFVIGFDSHHIFFKDVDAVNYSSARLCFNDIKDSKKQNQSLLYRNIFSKSLDWSYEREWRIFKVWVHKITPIKNNIIGLIECPLEVIKKIYLGARAPFSLCSKAQEFCSTHPNIELFRAKLHSTNYALEFERLTH